MAEMERVRYFCKNEGRRLSLSKQSTPVKLNGIDYLEVTNAAQTELTVFFVFNLPGQPNPVPPAPPLPEVEHPLSADNVLIEGGVRVKDIEVTGVVADRNKLVVTVKAPGDFSTYRLRLVESVADEARRGVPQGFDPQLAAIDFSFKASCPTEFDCRQVQECPPELRVEPVIDYLAKDYAGFRKLMLDRLSIVTPDWKTRNAADLGVAVVELLAYCADELSYYQDAVATEAYLGTARSRVSVRRHARLLDYCMHEGCNARAFVCFDVDIGSGADGATLAAKTPLVALQDKNAALDPDEYEAFDSAALTVFETMHDVTLKGGNSTIGFYTWDDQECCLPKGATRATLADPGSVALAEGQFLAFEEVLSPTTGSAALADPARRHVVRLTRAERTVDPLNDQAIVEIQWAEDDALPIALCLSAMVAEADGKLTPRKVTVARGNVVLADHGRTLAGESLRPGEAPKDASYRPRFACSGLGFAAPWQLSAGTSARGSLLNDLHQALPLAELTGGGYPWIPRFDLLSSERFANEFVVEMDERGRANIRFGDGVHGARPVAGADFTATYRIGNGRSGNVGREALNRVVTKLKGIQRVWNPLPAQGGADAELMEDVRIAAPQAFRVQKRAVTEADYERVAELHQQVQRAKARFRWTGSWLTVFLTVDRKAGKPVDEDPAFEQDLRDHLDHYRMAGYDLEIMGPVFVALELKLFVCVKPASFRSDVKRALNELFSNRVSARGELGFFHPDRLTFGDPLYLSRVVAAAAALEGVASCEVLTFKRLNKKAGQEKDNGIIEVGPMEILRLDNDANFPEHGKVDFVMEGGL